MALLYLVRHGLDDFSQEESMGRLQSRAAAQFFLSVGLDGAKILMISSELPRALKTAGIIKEVLGIDQMISRNILSLDHAAHTYTFLSDMVKAHGATFDAIIAVTHEPNILPVLTAFAAEGYRGEPQSEIPNGSVARVSPDERIVELVFSPAENI